MNLNKVQRVQRALNAIERGLWSEFSISECCDYIAWLAKFKKVSANVWKPMCEQATKIMEDGLA